MIGSALAKILTCRKKWICHVGRIHRCRPRRILMKYRSWGTRNQGDYWTTDAIRGQ